MRGKFQHNRHNSLKEYLAILYACYIFEVVVTTMLQVYIYSILQLSNYEIHRYITFSKYFRYNIDPFSQYSDDEIWDAVENVHMKEKVICDSCNIKKDPSCMVACNSYFIQDGYTSLMHD